MMKFAAITLLALVALVSANADEFEMEQDSQLSLQTTDEAETAALKGTPFIVFDGFCIKSRDHIFNDIKTNSNLLSSKVFAMFFDSAEQLGRDALDVSRTGADRLSGSLANPDSPIAEPTNDAERIIAQGQANIKSIQTQPLAFVEAFKTTVRAVSQTVGAQFSQKIESLKKMADLGTLVAYMQEACEAVQRYENESIQIFESYKSELAAADERIASVEFHQVPCTTTRRVSKIDGLCKFAAAAKAPVHKLWQTRN